ncbi:hypothetical protein ACFX2I_027897 [Malus domestica]
MNERDLIEDKIHHLKWSLKYDDFSIVEKQKLSSECNALEFQRDQVRFTHQQAQRECHQMFHKSWGQLMKTGYHNSHFAHQVRCKMASTFKKNTHSYLSLFL